MIILTVLLLVILIPVGVVVAKKKKGADTTETTGSGKLGEESARPDRSTIPVFGSPVHRKSPGSTDETV